MQRKGSLPVEGRPKGLASASRPGLLGDARPPLVRRRDRLMAWSAVVGIHVLLGGLFLLHAESQPPQLSAPSLMMVSLTDPPKPKPPGPPADMKDEAAMEIAPPVPPTPVMPIIRVSAPNNSDVLSESQLAGATSAGEGTGGGGGGGCDTARAVQQALRRDPLVHTAVSDANRMGKAIMVWNGDWVQTGGQDGKGLSAVREAIQWEVAFSPEACRNARMHGTLLLSLADGSTRFAIGSGEWRWADLLGLRRGAVSDR